MAYAHGAGRCRGACVGDGHYVPATHFEYAHFERSAAPNENAQQTCVMDERANFSKKVISVCNWHKKCMKTPRNTTKIPSWPCTAFIRYTLFVLPTLSFTQKAHQSLARSLSRIIREFRRDMWPVSLDERAKVRFLEGGSCSARALLRRRAIASCCRPPCSGPS